MLSPPPLQSEEELGLGCGGGAGGGEGCEKMKIKTAYNEYTAQRTEVVVVVAGFIPGMGGGEDRWDLCEMPVS